MKPGKENEIVEAELAAATRVQVAYLESTELLSRRDHWLALRK
jgi:hypothetical protein